MSYWEGGMYEPILQLLLLRGGAGGRMITMLLYPHARSSPPHIPVPLDGRGHYQVRGAPPLLFLMSPSNARLPRMRGDPPIYSNTQIACAWSTPHCAGIHPTNRLSGLSSQRLPHARDPPQR